MRSLVKPLFTMLERPVSCHMIFDVNSREPESFLRLVLDPVNAQPPGTQ